MLKQSKWSEDDKDNLQNLVNIHTINNRTNWIEISKHFQNRSANQCKLQYSIVLKKKAFKHINAKWSESDEDKLEMLVDLYGTKWKFIKQNYFPQYTTSQVMQKYHRFKKIFKFYEDLYSKLSYLKEEQFSKLTVQEVDAIQMEHAEYDEYIRRNSENDGYLFKAFCHKFYTQFKITEEQLFQNMSNILKYFKRI